MRNGVKEGMADFILINRAPVLTLWASVVAERLGFDRAAALTLGKAMAGLTAQTKGRSLGIFRPAKAPDGIPKKAGLGEEFWVEIVGRPIPAKRTKDGVRAVVKDQPIDPDGVERYLTQKFGESLEKVRRAMEQLARAFPPAELADEAYSLYARFRPEIPAGEAGWGAKGKLDLDLIRALAK
jgi:hypothetical protein